MVAWAVQVTAGTTSSSDRCQPVSASCFSRGANASSFGGQADGVDQDERLQFHGWLVASSSGYMRIR